MNPPPSESRWVSGVLTLFPSPGSPGDFEGVMTIDGVTIHVRHWHKVSGHIKFAAQYEGDAAFERLVDALAGRSEA